MRVVFVLWVGDIGGAELHTARLAHALRARGHWAGVLTISKAGPLDARLDELRVPHVSLPLRRGRAVLPHMRAVRGLLGAARPDVVVLPHNDGLSAALRLAGCRTPLVAVEHGAVFGYASLSAPRRLRRLAERQLGSRLLLGEIAVSHFAARAVAGLPHAPLSVIHNGIDVAAFRPADGPPRERSAPGAPPGRLASDRPVAFGIASRLIPGKGVDVALRALAAVGAGADGGPPTLLHVAGEGPERAALGALADRLGLASRVRFHGCVADMPAFWNAVDVAVHVPDTFVESFGLAALEAVACGCRAIVAGTEASREVLDGCPAVAFVPGADVAAVTAAFGEQRERGGPGPTERILHHGWVADRYSLSETARRYEDVLGSWLGASSTARPEAS